MKTGARAINWKVNFAVLWLSQFTIMAAFYLCLPFLSLFLLEHDIVPPDEVPFWGGIFFAAAPAALMIMSPIWGKLGDARGRKMMIIRSTLAGAIALYLMGSLTNIWMLIGLRFVQGAFSGTLPATQTLVTANTPKEKHGLALGLLMAAVAAGHAAGAFIGGLCASAFGTSFTFKIGGSVMVSATLLVLFAVRENFVPPLPPASNTKSARTRVRKQNMAKFVPIIPLLVAGVYVFGFQVYDLPLLPLYVGELYQSSPDAALVAPEAMAGNIFAMTGYLSALATVVSIAGSTLGGLLLDRQVPKWVWAVLALAGAAGLAWAAWGNSLLSLALGRSVFLFVVAGLASVLIVVLARIAPPEKRATMLSWSYTARSLGWTLAPLLGAFVVGRVGLAGSYLVLGVASLGLWPLFQVLMHRYPRASSPDLEPAPLPTPEDVAAMDRT